MSGNVRKLLCGGLLAIFICCIHTDAEAQRRGRGAGRNAGNGQRDTSSLRAAALPGTQRPADAPRPYREVITDKAVSWSGFLTVHKTDEKYFLEIPDALMGREMLVVNRIGGAPADFRTGRNTIGYAGDIIGQQIFHFERGEGNRLFIRMKSYKERSADHSANGLARSLERNNMEPIMNSFPLKAINDSAHSIVIEITDLLSQDNSLFGFGANAKTATGLGNIMADRSYVEGVKSSGDNIAFSFMRTYSKASGGGLTSGPQLPYTFQLRCGWMLLPAEPMAARASDRRTAFQEVTYIDFDNNPLGVLNKGMVCRWRLEPADRKAYFSGKLSAPVQPVKIYIDPAMPAQWRPYVRLGIEAWNTAFRKAGFKDAIRVIMPARSDTGSYLDDPNRSAVVFMPGQGESPGTMIVDPRSGEILQVQLPLYLGILDKLYKQYFIQAGALDKAANKPVFDEALMGRLIEAYTMQAMGGLLGMKTNAGASAANSISQLRNNSWLKTNAFNGSATDPVLVNYVVQPEDKVEAGNLLPKISATDEWMINWGYRVLTKPAEEEATLDKWIIEHTGPELYIGEPPRGNTGTDPRNQLGDLGNDAVQAAALGINNLKRVVPNLIAWTSEPATGNALAAELYEALLDQYATYAHYVVAELGGLYTNIRNSSQPGMVFSVAPAGRQRKALQFLQEQVFETPGWLVNKELYERTTQCFDSVTNIQRAILGEVLSRPVLQRLQTVMPYDSAAYAPLDFLTELGDGIFSELKDSRPVSLPRRELQREYLSRLLALIDGYAKADNDLPAVLNAHATSLLGLLKKQQSLYTGIGQAHVTALYDRLYTGLYAPANPSPTTRRN